MVSAIQLQRLVINGITNLDPEMHIRYAELRKEIMKQYRTFIAFEVSPDIQDHLTQIQTVLDWSQSDIKWVSAQNIHLTIHFLGNISKDQVNTIIENLPLWCRDLPIILSGVERLGAFPDMKRPRVIWADIADSQGLIGQFHNHLKSQLESLNVVLEDRPYHPHLTLGRVRHWKATPDLTNKLTQFSYDPPLQLILSKVILFESALTPMGPHYSPLEEVHLKDSSTPLQ